MSLFERERTSAEIILYALYLYLLGLNKLVSEIHLKQFNYLEKMKEGREGERKEESCCSMEMDSEIQ